jgi:hypothetical protein
LAVDIVADGVSPMLATEASVRATFDSEGGFWHFVILSRDDNEFIQAAHWWFMTRKTDTTSWYAAFETATAGLPDLGDTREPDLYAVEFRDAPGQYGVRQVFPRPRLLELFLA